MNLRIDQPDFRAEHWKKTTHNKKRCWISTCYELIGGRWEGFVAITFTQPKD